LLKHYDMSALIKNRVKDVTILGGIR